MAASSAGLSSRRSSGSARSASGSVRRGQASSADVADAAARARLEHEGRLAFAGLLATDEDFARSGVDPTDLFERSGLSESMARVVETVRARLGDEVIEPALVIGDFNIN